MGLYGVLWGTMGLYGAVMGLHGVLWGAMGCYGAVMGCYGSLWGGTVELLDAAAVVVGQHEGGGVHPLVEGRHDGRGVAGVLQAQRVAQLVQSLLPCGVTVFCRAVSS